MKIELKGLYQLKKIGTGQGFYIPNYEVKHYSLSHRKRYKIVLEEI